MFSSITLKNFLKTRTLTGINENMQNGKKNATLSIIYPIFINKYTNNTIYRHNKELFLKEDNKLATKINLIGKGQSRAFSSLKSGVP